MRLLTTAAVLLTPALSAFAATPVATYEFENTFAANEPGKPALTPTDPLGTSSFQTDTVLGNSHFVWAFRGSETPAQQAGLTLNTTGLVSPTSYSVDMIFEFFDRPTGWRRILDVDNRQSDTGFYVNPSSDLAVYPNSGSTEGWTNGIYHHVVFTNDGANIAAYLDGISQFTEPTTLMNLNSDPTNNPSRLLNIFLDNTASSGLQEWSSGNVSLFRIWDGVLTPAEAQALALNPYLPEPASLSLAGTGALFLARRRRR